MRRIFENLINSTKKIKVISVKCANFKAIIKCFLVKRQSEERMLSYINETEEKLSKAPCGAAGGEDSSVQNKVLDTVAAALDCESEVLSLKMDPAEAGIDSVTFIKIIVALEEKFGFVFDDEKLLIQEFPTIKALADYTETKLQLNN